MAGGHVDRYCRDQTPAIKAAVAQTPIIEGKDAPRKASRADGRIAASRTEAGARRAICAGARASNDVESRLALAEYHPFWSVEQIPQTTAVLFVIAENDARVNNETNAVAASKLLKGPTDVARFPGVDARPDWRRRGVQQGGRRGGRVVF